MNKQRGRRRLECEALEGRRCPAVAAAFPAADVPVERTDAIAVEQHEADLAVVAQGQAGNVVFLGDSITQWFRQGAGRSVWSREIAGLGAADLGVAGDTTNELLWRIENGELAGQPKVAVLMIGTNNLGDGESVGATVAGVQVDVAAIRAASPGTQILLNGVFPRGQADSSLRAEVTQVNAALAADADNLGVVYSDPGAGLVGAGGSIAPDFLPDRLHPNASGYEVWAGEVVGTVGRMLADATTTTTPAATSNATFPAGAISPTIPATSPAVPGAGPAARSNAGSVLDPAASGDAPEPVRTPVAAPAVGAAFVVPGHA